MKIIINPLLVSLFVLATSSAIAQNRIEVVVKNVKQQQGSIRIGLFNNEEDFLKKAVQGKVVKANATEVKVVFENLKAGDYAVSVIHDENDNGELDKNTFGIPKEGFAFGNNAMGMFGPPSFEKAKVSIGQSVTKQVIELKYF
jgi:uncharacterized protein (DUF2141 family)